MNSTVLRSSSLPRILSDKREVRPLRRKVLGRIGAGLILGMAINWLYGSVKTARLNEATCVFAPPDQAIYEWTGFHRVAPSNH